MAALSEIAEAPGIEDQLCAPVSASQESGSSDSATCITASSPVNKDPDPSDLNGPESGTMNESASDNGQDGSDTPHRQERSTDQLHKQVHLLEAKLKEMQDSVEQDRVERQKINERLESDDFPPRFPHPLTSTERLHSKLNKQRPWGVDRLRVHGYFDEPSEVYGREDHNYMGLAIRSYERELRALRKEKEKIDELRKEMGRLQTSEFEWEIQREELLKRIKKDEPKGTLEESDDEDETSEEAEEYDPSPQQEVETPALNYVEWGLFKANPQRSLGQSFAIDVLKGEPILIFENENTRALSRKARSRQKNIDDVVKARKAPATAKQVLLPGQAALPERIRINSAYITKVLEEIDNEAISTDSSVVMIRPYEALVYYEELIRQKFEGLRAGFATQKGDVEDKNHADADADAAGNLETNGDNNGKSKAESAEHTSATALPEDTEREGTSMQEEDQRQKDVNDNSALDPSYRHLETLIDFMENELRKKMDFISSDDCQKVSFADLWYLFKPGDEVIGQNRRQAYRIIEITSAGHKVIPPASSNFPRWDSNSEAPVILHCVYVDFDGKRLGPVRKEVKIQRFDGEKAVTSLEVFPLRYADSRTNGSDEASQSLRQRLIERGKKFLDVTTFKHMHYSGLTLDTRDEVDDHVVVDFEEAFSANLQAKWMPELDNLIGQSATEETEVESCEFDCCNGENIYKSHLVERKRNQEFIAGLMPDSENQNREPSLAIFPRSLEDIKRSENELDSHDLVIMSYRVFGFVLHSRKWAELDLTHLAPPIGSGKKDFDVHLRNTLGQDDKKITTTNGNDLKTPEKRQTAFNNLVLPDGHKKMIRSLIAQHFRDKEASSKQDARESEQVDIVRGKGKGLIILLHGAPGVGKTSTAEGVAEMFEKPLFQITCGDLGTTARDVDEALGTHFNLANKWGCVLLLDEADVFLAARSKEDFKRNGLVSVFLRVLEYYAGILFLTTNRVGDFDEAFTSRIHISLYYPQLKLDPTKEIFMLNIRLIKQRFENNSRQISIEEEKIVQFAERYWNSHDTERWNGRQIRNACQTALALAEFDAQGGDHKQIVNADAEVKLGVHHLEVVSKAYLEFMDYLNKVRDKDEERWAKALKIRAREKFLVVDKPETKNEAGNQQPQPISHPQHSPQPASNSGPANLQPQAPLSLRPAAQPAAPMGPPTPQPQVNHPYPLGAVPNAAPQGGTYAAPMPSAWGQAPTALPPGGGHPPQMPTYYPYGLGYPPQAFAGYQGMPDGQQNYYGTPSPHPPPPGSNVNQGPPAG